MSNLAFTRHGQQPGLYTIGVWEGGVQRAICHDACIDCALAAIRREMEVAAEASVVLNPHDPGSEG